MAQSTGDVTGTFFRNEPTDRDNRERAISNALYLAEHKTKHGHEISADEVLEDAAKFAAFAASTTPSANGECQIVQISENAEEIATKLRLYVLTKDEVDYIRSALDSWGHSGP